MPRLRPARMQGRAAQAIGGMKDRGWQSLIAETGDYSEKSFERSQALAGTLSSVTRIEEAIRLQSEFAKLTYDAFIAHATNIGSLYSDIAKEAFKTTKVASSGKVPTNFPQSSRVPPVAVSRS